MSHSLTGDGVEKYVVLRKMFHYRHWLPAVDSALYEGAEPPSADIGWEIQLKGYGPLTPAKTNDAGSSAGPGSGSRRVRCTTQDNAVAGGRGF